MSLKIKPKSECRWDEVSLGEVMLRFDPGDHRIATTRHFEVFEGGGEYNVARGLKRCFDLETAHVTALADNPVGRLVEDLMYQGGLQYMRYSVSDTAEYGDYVSGPRVVNGETRDEMRRILGAIQDGTFAKQWVAESRAGGPEFRRMRREHASARIEEVGAELRSHMTFLNPKHAPQGWAEGAGYTDASDRPLAAAAPAGSNGAKA